MANRITSNVFQEEGLGGVNCKTNAIIPAFLGCERLRIARDPSFEVPQSDQLCRYGTGFSRYAPKGEKTLKKVTDAPGLSSRIKEAACAIA